jgi:hypothetical protein
MDISHDHTDFGPQIPFLSSGGLYSPIFFIYIKFTTYHMTYFIFDPADSNFFGLKTFNIKLQSILRF